MYSKHKFKLTSMATVIRISLYHEIIESHNFSKHNKLVYTGCTGSISCECNLKNWGQTPMCAHAHTYQRCGQKQFQETSLIKTFQMFTCCKDVALELLNQSCTAKNRCA